MTYNYFNPVKIIIGENSLKKLSELLRGRSALLVTTPGMLKRGVVDKIRQICNRNRLYIFSEVINNPTVIFLDGCLQETKNYKYDVVIGLGGGSSLDTAKIIALMSCISAKRRSLDSILRHNREIELKSAKPIIAIPTTSGTGSEVTPWATVWDDISGEKYSISDKILFPEYALLDFKLTYSLPYEITLFSALDALSHSMEAIWNNNANPISDILAIRAINISIPILRDNFKNKYAQRETRRQLQLASLFAGLAFSNTKTAIAHSISYPLTAKLDIPHGLACSFALPEIMRINYRQDKTKVSNIVEAMGYSSLDVAADKLQLIFRDLEIRKYLQRYFLKPYFISGLKANFISPDRAKNNVASVSQGGAIRILRLALSRYSIQIIE